MTTAGRSAARAVVALPDVVGVLTLATVLATTVPAVFGLFHPALVLPLLAVSAVLLLLLVRHRTPGEPERWSMVGTVVVVAAAVVWVLVQLRYTSQLVQIDRDPGIYLLRGIWLAGNGSLGIDVTAAQDIAHAAGVGSADLGAFAATDRGTVDLQASAGQPALVALATWIGGLATALGATAALGGVVLVLCYGLTRRLLGPLWGMLPVAALALGMPLVYFSRANFSEILTLALFLIGITALIRCLRGGGFRMAVVAGLALGATTMVRADAALGLIGVLGALVLIALGLVSLDRTALRTTVLGVIAGAVVPVVIGIVDLVINVPGYLVDELEGRAGLLWIALIALAIAALVLVTVIPVPPLARVVDDHRRVVALVCGAATALFFGVLLTRPLWWQERVDAWPSVKAMVESLQAIEGLPIDPMRGYDEYSLFWFAWYYGWPFLLVAIAGIAWAVVRAIDRGEADLLVFLTLGGAAAVLYLISSRVAPDQIWAFRRMVPLVLPLFLVGATLVMRDLFRWGRSRGRGALVPAAVVVVVAVIAAGTVLPWRGGGLLRLTEYEGLAAESATICRTLEGNEQVVIESGSAPGNYAVTLRVLCGVDVISLEELNAEDLEAIAAAVPGPLGVVSFSAVRLAALGAGEEPAPTAESLFRIWDRRLLGTPAGSTLRGRAVWIGEVASDGSVRIVPGATG